jgi:ubiquinone/menaquinone biosynthesis C-methylase UbiE
MELKTDRHYLKTSQYGTPVNLEARIALHARFGVAAVGWAEWVFNQLEEGSGKLTLEIGAGSGALWQANGSRVPPGWHIVLTDLSSGMLQSARSNAADMTSSPHFAACDAQAIPFPPGSFDAVIANHMLYHVPDRPMAVAEIYRVLKPGGRLYTATNGKMHMRELLDLARQFEVGSPDPAMHEIGFDLETGAAQLAPPFEAVELRLYESCIRATEPEPVVDYIRSMWRFGDAPEDRYDRLRAHVAEIIAVSGAMEVTKSSGLFVARK